MTLTEVAFAQLQGVQQHHAEVIGQHILDFLDLLARIVDERRLPGALEREGTEAYLHTAVARSAALRHFVNMNPAWYAERLRNQAESPTTVAMSVPEQHDAHRQGT